LLLPLDAAYELGMSTKTIYRWDQAGKLRTMRNVGNQRRIPIEEIVRLRRQGDQAAERCVLYARVSSVREEQDGGLSRQTTRLQKAAVAHDYEVVQAFSWKGVRLEVLDPPKQQEPTEELIQDMFTMVIEPKVCANAWKARGSECE
jgi:predicted site-specific integrase-resolvase